MYIYTYIRVYKYKFLSLTLESSSVSRCRRIVWRCAARTRASFSASFCACFHSTTCHS